MEQLENRDPLIPHCRWWRRCYIIRVGDGAECGDIEKELIRSFADTGKLRNVRPGGEQALAAVVSFVYVSANSAHEAADIAVENARIESIIHPLVCSPK